MAPNLDTTALTFSAIRDTSLLFMHSIRTTGSIFSDSGAFTVFHICLLILTR